MTKMFDGRSFSKKKETELVGKLKNKETTPKLISIIVGDDPASKLYINLKKKAGEKIGCKVGIKKWETKTGKRVILNAIQKYNKDDGVHGIMVQLPLPKNFSKSDRDQILNSIDPEKDVDGLNENSNFITPTAKAVQYALGEALRVRELQEPRMLNIVRRINKKNLKVVVVGSNGFEGKKITKNLRQNKFKVIGISSNVKNNVDKTMSADVLISVTGVPNLIRSEMIKPGAILIDVGSPKGDIEKKAYEKASFVSPVPGGVGPVTISCLLENLITAN